ncbi:MAG: hypothetical protein JSV33_12360 [bacterium]|nr:MAG: hypothetical protein JSV33_12360 [bacterium]
MSIADLEQVSRDLLEGMIVDFAKNWLAHDGLWFQEVERRFGLQAAMELDARAWDAFTRIEAKRIMVRHGIGENGGLEALKEALGFRLYAILNEQTITEETEHSFVFKMVDCRVQSARERKGMQLFPCKSVGVVEYSGFASTIDPRIRTECIACPPDCTVRDFYCGWRFSL